MTKVSSPRRVRNTATFPFSENVDCSSLRQPVACVVAWLRRYHALRDQGAAMKRLRMLVVINDNPGGPLAVEVVGRDAWALDHLMLAGSVGCTPITTPGPRWSHYVWKLRHAGFVIETAAEPHGGPFAGSHARYFLRSTIRVIKRTRDEGAAEQRSAA
jgi:hypothetical protein